MFRGRGEVPGSGAQSRGQSTGRNEVQSAWPGAFRPVRPEEPAFPAASGRAFPAAAREFDAGTRGQAAQRDASCHPRGRGARRGSRRG